MQSLIAMLIVGIMSAFMLGQSMGKREGIAEGRSMALKTNPVSEELEQTCFSLWLGEQAKKAWEKENAGKDRQR